jgi:Type I phosphodiesterase / nucleotide pyrophosphatase
VPHPLVERLRARGFVMPDYDGGGLLNVPTTVLDVLGARDAGDAPPLVGLDPALRDGVRQVVVILADGLGWWQLEMLCEKGDMPFLAGLRDRAQRRDGAQLLEVTTVFPSTTAAAITTMNTARTPLEHGNIAYFVWLEEFAQVTAMLRWGPANVRRGSYFDDPAVDPLRFVLVPSIHARLRQRGVTSYVVEPEIFRSEAMTRMHAAEANFLGYVVPSTMGVRLRALLDAPRPPTSTRTGRASTRSRTCTVHVATRRPSRPPSSTSLCGTRSRTAPRATRSYFSLRTTGTRPRTRTRCWTSSAIKSCAHCYAIRPQANHALSSCTPTTPRKCATISNASGRVS